ncbi:ComF family protein [Paenibacillus sp. M1]|uniref:ComF family protein n=1 Tax=Paenibacillus haidiansis TaxID=1574488 RepID=A0ABU7VXU2_9BACL
MTSARYSYNENVKINRERRRIWNRNRPVDHDGGGSRCESAQGLEDVGLVEEQLVVSPYSRIDWDSAKEAMLSPLHNLLAPPGLPCLTCGKMISNKTQGYPEICSSCYASIPWIKHPRCEICGRHVGCPDCSREGRAPRYYVLNRSAVSYNATMKEWLAQYKFRGNEALGTILARMTGKAALQMARELGEQKRQRSSRFDAVTYVPVSNDRMLERGFNQAEQLAAGAASVLGLPLLELLERTQHTEKQSFKNRWQRLRDLQGVFGSAPDAEDKLTFALNNPKRCGFPFSIFATGAFDYSEDYTTGPVRLLLIDDVYTTGSTVNACSAVLRKLCLSLGRPAEIYSLTWARS